MNVLFLCTGNSARSILAEALSNDLPALRGRLKAYSAGSHPKAEPNPLAIDYLRGAGIPVNDLRSKSWDEFSRPDAPRMDIFITVCDQAAGEQCPFWPGQPVTAHWGMPDPAAVTGPLEERRRAFAECASALKHRIERLASLPFERLEGLALKDALGSIAGQ